MTFAGKIQKGLIAVALITMVAVELPIIAVGYFSKPEPADALIVLGAKLIGNEPSAMLRLRLDETIKLYSEGYAPNIIVSGARGRDEIASEASVMQNYLIAHGIPSHRIIVEDRSFNTYQNLSNSQAIMTAHGLKRAIIVSNSSHIRRSLALARTLGLEATGAPAPMANNAYLTTKQYLREGAAMLALTIFNK